MANRIINAKDVGARRVADSQHIDEETREVIKRLLLERLSLSGICRVIGVSLRWLLNFIVELYNHLPDELNVRPSGKRGQVRLLRLEAEADEMASFVGAKTNKQWNRNRTRHTNQAGVIAFYVGERQPPEPQQLWKRLPEAYRECATFYTDGWAAYQGVIPAARHQVLAKSTGHTNMVERFNCTLRQRVSRLVRAALSFSRACATTLERSNTSSVITIKRL